MFYTKGAESQNIGKELKKKMRVETSKWKNVKIIKKK